MRTRTTTATAVFAAAALLLAACGDDSSSTGATGDSPNGTTASQASFNQQDKDFAAGMRAHHAQAVEMAEMVLAANPTPEVADLAERIKTAQGPEITELDRMLEQMDVEAASSSGHGSTHGADMPMHNGMMTDEQMMMLDSADGVEACRQFLTLMQEHHAGAIDSAEKQLADGRHPPLMEMAEDIRDSQTAEITEMQRMLSKL